MGKIADLSHDFYAEINVISDIIGGYEKEFREEIETIVLVGIFGLNSDYLVMGVIRWRSLRRNGCVIQIFPSGIWIFSDRQMIF